jgi:hypothetical protein
MNHPIMTTTTTTTTRRDLLRNAAIFGGALFFSRNLIACAIEKLNDDDDDNGESASSDLVTCQAPVISANHGHTLSVPSADITAGVEKTYSIKGQSSHDHLLTITAAQFAALGAGGSITVTSSNVGGHTHSVRVTCAASTNPDAGSDASTPDGSAGGGDSSTDAATSACSNGASASSISANHGHTLTVPRADIQAGATRTYSIKGTSSHPHDVTITASDFTRLKNGETLTLTSTNVGGHTHAVKVICA